MQYDHETLKVFIAECRNFIDGHNQRTLCENNVLYNRLAEKYLKIITMPNVGLRKEAVRLGRRIFK